MEVSHGVVMVAGLESGTMDGFTFQWLWWSDFLTNEMGEGWE